MADPAQAFRCIGQTKFDDLKHWQRVVIFVSGVTASFFNSLIQANEKKFPACSDSDFDGTLTVSLMRYMVGEWNLESRQRKV